MDRWKPFPLIRLLIPFLLGVMVVVLFPAIEGVSLVWIGSPIACLAVCQLLIYLRKPAYRYRWLSGVVTEIIFFMLGIASICCRDGNNHTWVNQDNPVLWYCELVDVPKKTNGSIRFPVRCYLVDSTRQALIQRDGGIAYIEQDSAADELFCGDRLLVFASLVPIAGAKNPYSFDALSWYRNKGISCQIFLKRHQWKKTTWRNRVSIRGLASRYREKMRRILVDHAMHGDELAVASALLLGDTREIGSDLRQGYAACGVMHVLAVSGMHVGIVYLFLELALGFLKRWSAGRWIRVIILLLAIWIYALITGMSPSVFRAALMLSFVIVGLSLRRHPEMLNVLAASMFIILIFNPRLLLNLGFQFSYLAVTGILALYKPLNNLGATWYWLAKKCWSLMAVSLAAQLATFPLALYAFHQFPNYFLLTNLLVAPLASLIIYAGIALLSLNFFPPVALLFAKVLQALVWLLNQAVQMIEGLPGALSSGIYISAWDSIILYLLIVSSVLFFFLKRVSWFYFGLACVLALSLTRMGWTMQQSRSREMVVYSIREGVMMSFRSGTRLRVMGDSTGLSASFSGELIRRYAGYEGARSIENSLLQDSGYQFLFENGLRIGVVKGSLPEGRKATLPLDVVVLRGNSAVSLESVMHYFSPEQIVMEGSITLTDELSRDNNAEEAGMTCHWLSRMGAFRRGD